MFLNNLLQFTGIQYTTVANTTLISATTPALTALLVAGLGERLSRRVWIGIGLSFCGVMFIVSHGSLDAVLALRFGYGDVLCLLSQCAWAVYSVLSLSVMGRFSALGVTGWASVFGFIINGVYGFFMGELAFPMPGPRAALSFAYITVLGGMISMFLWNFGVKEVGASVTAIFLNFTPVVGMIAGYVLFGEVIGAAEGFGALLIGCGVCLTASRT